MAQNIIILAGIPASGKSTTLDRLQPEGSPKLPEDQPQMAGLPSFCFKHPTSFVAGPLVDGRQPSHPLPEGPAIIHWGFPASKRDGGSASRLGLPAMYLIKNRVEVVLLLVCSYRCLIARMWHKGDGRRRAQFCHATDPAQILENYERLRDECDELGLKVRLVDTTQPDTLDFTAKSLHDILANGMSLADGKAASLGLLEEAGYERIA